MNLFDCFSPLQINPSRVLNQIYTKAFIRLSPTAPLADPALRTSMHKTYTDCYKMQGFVGGQWAYSLNANHPDGVALSDITTTLAQDDRRLALYFLGWESIEVCVFPNLRNICWIHQCLTRST